MVTYAQLKDAKPTLFATTAEDMRTLAEEAERLADNVRLNGVHKVEANWTDAVGAKAAGRLKSAANRSHELAVLARSAYTALEALAAAVTAEQRSLTSYVEYAVSWGMSVDTTGTVHLPREREIYTPEEWQDLARRRAEAQRLIDDTVEAATQADELCSSSLSRISVDPDTLPGTPEERLDEARKRQSQVVQDSLQGYRDALPDGLTAEQQRQWWDSLTPQQQEDFEKAVPVDLAALPGVPDDVKASMRRSDRGYDALKTTRFALQNWDNTSIDHFDNNCTNFVSTTLNEGGGLPYAPGDHAIGGLDITKDSGGWGRALAGEWGLPYSEHLSYTKSWSHAPSQEQFFLSHGGEQLDASQVRPGDVVYWQYDDGTHTDPGESIHHAAVVTAVLPDGEILYTQHSGSARNSDLQGRMPVMEDDYGRQKLIFVRPERTW